MLNEPCYNIFMLFPCLNFHFGRETFLHEIARYSVFDKDFVSENERRLVQGSHGWRCAWGRDLVQPGDDDDDGDDDGDVDDDDNDGWR